MQTFKMKERFLEAFLFYFIKHSDSLWYQWEFNHAAMSEGGEAGSSFLLSETDLTFLKWLQNSVMTGSMPPLPKG